MPERFPLASLLTALALTLPLVATAETSPAALTAAERAQREADRVFDVIKFHTIRSKPAEASKPSRLPSPPAQRPTQPLRPAPGAVAVTAPAAEPAEAGPTQAAGPTAGVAAAPALNLPASAQPGETPSMGAPTVETEPEGEAEDPDEVPLRMQSFVAPVLTPALQATLGAGERHVRVRLTVEADGKVSQAEAAAGVPRRLARPAVDAILQWQFAPLPQARTAEVEIAFRRD